MNVKDKIYKVIRESRNSDYIVEEFQVLNIRRYGRLDCFRTNGKDHTKAQWHFSPADVDSTPEEAVKRFIDQINVQINFYKDKIKELEDNLAKVPV